MHLLFSVLFQINLALILSFNLDFVSYFLLWPQTTQYLLQPFIKACDFPHWNGFIGTLPLWCISSSSSSPVNPPLSAPRFRLIIETRQVLKVFIERSSAICAAPVKRLIRLAPASCTTWHGLIMGEESVFMLCSSKAISVLHGSVWVFSYLPTGSACSSAQFTQEGRPSSGPLSVLNCLVEVAREKWNDWAMWGLGTKSLLHVLMPVCLMCMWVQSRLIRPHIYGFFMMVWIEN